MRFLTQYHTRSRNPHRFQNPAPLGECGFESYLRHGTKALQSQYALSGKGHTREQKQLLQRSALSPFGIDILSRIDASAAFVFPANSRIFRSCRTWIRTRLTDPELVITYSQLFTAVQK